MVDVKLSVIIVNWNTRIFLINCLRSIKQNFPDKLNYEIIVVDNASVDGSNASVRELYPDVILIANKHNVGFAKANNQAARIARGKYLLLLNSDTVVIDTQIEGLVNYLEAHPEVGIVTGKTINPEGSLQRSYRRFPDLWRMFCNHTMRLVKGIKTKSWRYFCLEHLDPDKTQFVDWVTGAYLMLPRRLLENRRLFDEDMHMYYEDTLLCRKLRTRGLEVVYLPFALVIHYSGQSARQDRPRAVACSFLSSVAYVKKVYGCSKAREYSFGVRTTWWLFWAILYVFSSTGNTKIKERRQYFQDLLLEVRNR